MASVVDKPLGFGPGFNAHCTFDSVADPTLLSDPLAGFFDSAFFQLPDPYKAPYVGIGDDSTTEFSSSTPPDTFNTDIFGDAGSDLVHRDSFDVEQPDTANQDAKSLQTTPDAHKPAEPDNKRKSPKRSTRRNRGDTANTPEARARREMNLEKNRLVANKYRKKKQDWMDRLEDKHRQVSAHNKLLRAELAELHDNVYGLKELVLSHATCGSPIIDEYVRHEAEQIHARMGGT